MALAGLLEIADREFQAIQDSDAQLRQVARDSVERGSLTGVEITPDSLRSYLDKKLGPDGRMGDWSYEFMTRLLKHLDFRSLNQVDDCIAGYDDDSLSRYVWLGRQGQISRFELMLLAGLGDAYIEKHFWSSESWFKDKWKGYLKKLKECRVPIRNFNPTTVRDKAF